MSYKSIKVVKGNGGFGGPLVITPSEAKHKFIYITGGGEKPDIVDKIADLTGMEAVNGFKTSIPDEEIALAIVDCGGTLRCGIYPKKGDPYNQYCRYREKWPSSTIYHRGNLCVSSWP